MKRRKTVRKPKGCNRKAKDRMHYRAKKRALKIYGLRLSGKSLTKLLNEVLAGNCTRERKDPDGRSLYRHELYGVQIRFVYDPHVHAIVTFLPL